MPTPKKKNKPAVKKAAAPKKRSRKPSPASAAKPSATAKKAASPAAKSRTQKAGASTSPSSARASRPSLTAREKLAVIRPSGAKDDNSFFDLVHDVARQIPRGRVTSYGAIAAALGTRGSARMVGWAMNACHLSRRPVPAHRVINSAGLLTGRHHFNPPEKMQQLLEKEGIKVKNNKVVEFKRLFWDPASEL